MDTSHCLFVTPTGDKCNELAEKGDLCFWHQKTPKDNVKNELEAKAKNRQSLAGFHLVGQNLHDTYLMEANLSYADLSRTDLSMGHLFGVNLSGASLFKANLRDANLKEANLENADLLGADLTNANLERVKWGHPCKVRNHTEADELASKGQSEAALTKYLEAEEIYRNIRKCYEFAGTSDVAGSFFYNEMVVRRKQMPIFSFARLWSKLIDILCGYGEIPYRIIGSAITYILFNAVIFDLLGMYHNSKLYAFDATMDLTHNVKYLGYAIYFSIVTFTTLGYGDFSPAGWSRPFAAIESFIGAFMIALFILSFVKKMTR